MENEEGIKALNRPLDQAGDVIIVGAIYHVEDGSVELCEEEAY